MALRVERLSGRSTDPAAAAALAESWQDQGWKVMPFYLSALVEQALRAATPDLRQAHLDRLAGRGQGLLLPFGYQADLDRLRTV